jgi:predicted DNA-binding protein YlxM (UPF0122 family)
MKKYLLTLFGDFRNNIIYNDINIVLTPLVDSNLFKTLYSENTFISYFESELELQEIHDFLEISSYGLYDSFILTEYNEKVTIFMNDDNKNHLFGVNDKTNISKPMDILSNDNIDDYSSQDDDEFVSTIMNELKKQLKPITLDQILDKINLEGIGNLTPFEKGLLENYSKN